ncbi:MAG: DUF4276 family protein [Chloroflexi bacterium]|nr:DUF4276 family protein [Chloroflexota bacterium]
MKFVHVLVEGQTEETFVRDVLGPYLNTKGIHLTPSLLVTKRVKDGPNFTGGITSYQRVKADLLLLLGDTNAVLVTTMLDYYGLPPDFPRPEALPPGPCFARVAGLEAAFQQDIGHRRFLPYLALHEFEALLFVDPDAIAKQFPDLDISEDLHAIRRAFISPEEINEEQPPSRRLRELVAAYQKPFHGPLITSEIGLADIRAACQHFAAWLARLETAGD